MPPVRALDRAQVCWKIWHSPSGSDVLLHPSQRPKGRVRDFLPGMGGFVDRASKRRNDEPRDHAQAQNSRASSVTSTAESISKCGVDTCAELHGRLLSFVNIPNDFSRRKCSRKKPLTHVLRPTWTEVLKVRQLRCLRLLTSWRRSQGLNDLRMKYPSVVSTDLHSAQNTFRLIWTKVDSY